MIISSAKIPNLNSFSTPDPYLSTSTEVTFLMSFPPIINCENLPSCVITTLWSLRSKSSSYSSSFSCNSAEIFFVFSAFQFAFSELFFEFSYFLSVEKHFSPLIYFWQLTVVFSLALVLLSSFSELINSPTAPEKSIRAMIAIARQADILNFRSCIIRC